MSATTAADLLLEVKQARPWDRARLVKEYSATHPNELPVETLSLILNDVSVNAKGNTVIDAIPAVLRSGSDPYTACCELEAMVEVCDAVTLMPARPRNRHARTPAGGPVPSRVIPVIAEPPQKTFEGDKFNKDKCLNEITKIKPAAPIVGEVIAQVQEPGAAAEEGQ